MSNAFRMMSDVSDPTAIVNGEHLLLGGTPPGYVGNPVLPAYFYKRRYTWDGEPEFIGCAIGCSFCYYRWINNTVDTIGTGKAGLRRIGPPSGAAQFLEQSKLFGANRDIVMLSARSDGSMQVESVTQFLHEFTLPNWVFVLHRGYFGARQLEQWGRDSRVVYCTTITPKPPESGPGSWSPIDPDRQLAGIQYLLDNGIPHQRISIMTGPFNSNNVDAGVELLHTLGAMGFEFVTYRGCSVGNFGVAPDDDKLRDEGFLDGGQNEESAPGGHDYYRMKNWLAPAVEHALLAAGKRAGLRMYRFTGTLYKNEYGVSVAYNRNNRWREEIGQWNEVDVHKLNAYLTWLGYTPLSIEITDQGYFVTLPDGQWATEDVAMSVGAEFETSVIFNNHRIAPTLEDLRFYANNRLFWPLPEGWEHVVNNNQ
ncbi:MAG: hypothetical protein COV44_10580 [Deltaproteobacteria bacterium CG11_big_fil_rev_8_21_14_0_20_45_16]|nr:MAG: hypothetical protein COV44_10580 [Deltaproteobacteria bacterium CG11_big_fil_rev_8_21_14_0_20_45_16]